jgi:hypothetical protein
VRRGLTLPRGRVDTLLENSIEAGVKFSSRAGRRRNVVDNKLKRRIISLFPNTIVKFETSSKGA